MKVFNFSIYHLCHFGVSDFCSIFVDIFVDENSRNDGKDKQNEHEFDP